MRSAFTGQAAVGGFLGAGMREAMRYGVARGLFSNESGLGSAPIVAAAAQTKNPVRQALVSSTGTFWDTVVVCAHDRARGRQLGRVDAGARRRGAHARGVRRPAGRRPDRAHGRLLTFVFSTILGWSYYGEKACEYLFGPASIRPYRGLWVLAVMVGSVAPLPIVWSVADITNALMAIPNLISLLVLTQRDRRRDAHAPLGRERPRLIGPTRARAGRR